MRNVKKSLKRYLGLQNKWLCQTNTKMIKSWLLLVKIGIKGFWVLWLVDWWNYYKPTIVLSLTDGVYKGSGRTFGDFDLYQFMNTFHDLYDTFGGHASALGLAISPEQLDVLKTSSFELS